jgi:DNA-binding beta-propeller fold protein YncE
VLLTIATIANAANQLKYVAEIAVEKPLHVALAKDGTVFVTTKDGAVVVFSADGKELFKFQDKGPSGERLLKKPSGIAVYGDRVYVCDKSEDRINIFSTKGEYLESFGEGGSGAKQFKNPEGIFVYQGVIYVADYSNDRIQVFGDNGVYIQSIGTAGEGEPRLKSPTDVAVDNLGNVYAVDSDSRTVKVYRQDGEFTGKLQVGAKPFAMAITDDGLFVSDADKLNVTKYSFRGERLIAFGTIGDGRVQFRDIYGIAADASGKVYVVDRERKNLQIIATGSIVPNDSPLAAAPVTSVRWLSDIRQESKKVAWDRVNGLLYAVDPEKQALVVIKDGSVQNTIKIKDINPVAVAVGPGGRPWIFDKEESQLVKLDKDGNVIVKVGASGGGDGYFSKPRDIAVGRDGFVYVADTKNDRVQVFNSDGVFMNAYTKGADNQSLDTPIAVDVDAKGNIYLLLESRKTVAVIAPNGAVLREVGGRSSGRGGFDEPIAVAVSGNELMVLDTGTGSIKVFNLHGDFLREFGAKGSGKGDFKKPAAIAVVNENSFYVADSGNARIEELRTVYTPVPPRGVKAKADMRSVAVSWTPAEEPYVEGFTLFRSEDGQPYRKIAEVKGNSYHDADLLPDKKLSYRVSARVKGGNENISTESATAVPLKFTPKPPVALDAKSQEWSVDLTWQLESQAYFDYFNVYRDSDEEDAPPTLLAKTKEMKFSEGGLDSDTAYTYLISAVSIDGVESERVPIDVSTIVATRPPMEIDIIQMQDIFSNTYKIYENEGIGKVRLTNNTREEIVALKLAFTIKEYMDFPTEIEVKSLPPKQSIDITLKAVFNNRILEVTEDTPVQTELKASYFENQKQRSFSRNNTVQLYEKHRMMWINKDRVATFVTSKDPVVLEFTRSVVTQYADIGSPLVFAAAIYDYLGHTGMTYLQHPNNPYQIVEGKTNFVDYVQYPRETLKRNSGVCTDLVVFYAAALEGLGIRTLLLGTPEHIFIMFAVGQVADLGDSTMNGMFAIHEGTVWVPVELTLVGSTFMKAWETGSKEYYEWKEKGVEITDLGKAWGRYKPATLPVSDWRAQLVKRADIDNRYGNEMAKLNKIKLKYTSNRFFAQINSNPADGNAYHQLGIIYGEAGELDDALKYLEKARALLPENAEVTNNLANLYFLKKDYKAAQAAYEKAAELDKADPYILVNLTLCYLKLDNREKAIETFKAATSKDPVLLKKHRTLAVDLLGSM